MYCEGLTKYTNVTPHSKRQNVLIVLRAFVPGLYGVILVSNAEPKMFKR